MEIAVLIGLLGWAIPTAGLAFYYVNDHRGKFSRLRYLYSRICMPLTDAQIVGQADQRLDKLRHLFPSNGLAYITAIEFLDDPIMPGRRLMTQLERFSPSIFPGSVLRVWVYGTSTAVVLAPAVLFALGMVPQAQAIAGGRISFALALGAAGVVGVLLSFALVIVVSRAMFENHFREVKGEIDKLTVWEPGREPRPINRTISVARDDPTYKSFEK